MNSKTQSGADIADWRPEDEKFWESRGKKIAYRNLWISVPALLCGFEKTRALSRRIAEFAVGVGEFEPADVDLPALRDPRVARFQTGERSGGCGIVGQHAGLVLRQGGLNLLD